MSNNTQTVNNTSKIQQGPVKTALKMSKESPVNFNDLFADAMGQNTPKAQLSTFETQMREALGKQDEQKTRDPENNPMAAETAQSMVWAQRNWASQQSPDRDTAQADYSTSATSTERQPEQASAQAITPEQSSTAEASAKPSADSNQAASQTKQQPNQTTTQAEPPKDNTQAQAAVSSTSPALATSQTATPSSGLQAEGLNTTTLASGNPDSATLKTQQSIDQTRIAPIQVTPTDGTTEDSSQALSTHAEVLDQKVSSADTPAPKARDLPSQEKLNTIANPLAVQNVSAQLGQQRAAMAASNNDVIEVQTLKAGDQKLTTASAGSAVSGLATTLGNGPKAAAQTLIKTPVNQPGFARELGQTVNWALGRGMSTVDIRVNPESFGPMNMRLVQKGQQVQLIIRTQDEASANLMTQAIAGLKETLAQSGLNLQQVQVQHSQASQANIGNPSFQQSMQGSGNGQQPGSESRSAQGSQGQRTSDTPDDSVAHATTSRNTSKTGGIDLFA